MAEQNVRKGVRAAVKPEHPKSLADWKPGSEGDQAAQVYSEGDFGVHESKASRGERDYTSRNTKVSGPGQAQPWSREDLDGSRTAGAGAHDSGEGSGSGGDVDLDIVGVGTGGTTVSQSGPSDRRGADETDGTSREFASGRPATGRVPAGADRFTGTTFTGDAEADPAGADNATNSGLRDDDSFKGEVSAGEARGEDSDAQIPDPA